MNVKKIYTLLLYLLAILILMITLFYGLKPKGYRFINQVEWLENKKGLNFIRTGMIYSEKKLGNLGISDSLTIILGIKPKLFTRRRLQRIISIIDNNGKDILVINQWRRGIEIIVKNQNGTQQIVKRGISNVLSSDSICYIAAGISGKTVWITAEHSPCIQTAIKNTSQFTPDYLEKGSLLFGFRPSGKNPWRGELTELVIGDGSLYRIVSDVLNGNHDHLCDSFPTIARFLFEKHSNRIVKNQCQSSWNLIVPKFPKIFVYLKPQFLQDITSINRSLGKDMLINFTGFIPFGIIFFLVFYSLHKKLLLAGIYTFFFTLFTSTGIEIVQIFIPPRSSQVIDIILNTTGALSGVVMTATVINYFINRKNP